MLDRVEMNIFNMSDKIIFIPDLVFPITTLPYCLFTFITS